MEWLRENWFWLVLGAVFFWMHTKMHGGHGGHGGHSGSAGGGSGGSHTHQGSGSGTPDAPGRKEHRHA